MSVLQHFEEYQKARVKFVQAVAEAATRPQNIEVMNNAGVMQLLRPLLLDNVYAIYCICCVYSSNQYYVCFRFQVFNRRQHLLSEDLQITAKTWQKPL